MISAIQHFAFCKRQWALIHIEQLWLENLLTIQGLLFHETAHSGKTEKRGEKIIARSLRVSSKTLMVTGICDVVEFIKDDKGINIHGYKGLYRVVPVEYKKGKEKEGNFDRLQLCIQAICLEEMLLTTIDKGYLYYGETKKRSEVIFSRSLREEVKNNLKEMNKYYKIGYTPKVKTSKKCTSCSLKDICLPRLNKNSSVKEYMKKNLFLKEGENEKVT